MAYTVNRATKKISIPKADLVLVSGTLFELDTEVFRTELHTLQSSEEGIVDDDMMTRNAPYTVAGITYAQSIEVINGFSNEFEDGAYSCRLIGSNNNIFDIENGILVQNQVQIIPNNSAGLVNLREITQASANSKYLIEAATRRSHRGFGDIFYWNPFNGLDANDGLLPNKAVLTQAAAEALVTDGNGDVVFVISPEVATPVIMTPLTFTKSNTYWRFNGLIHVHVDDAANPAVHVTSTADGSEVSGIIAKNLNAAQPCIKIAAWNVSLQKVEAHDGGGNGIEVIGGSGAAPAGQETRLVDVNSRHNAGHGVYIHDRARTVYFSGRTHIEENVDGVRIEDDVLEVHLEQPILHLNFGWGVNIMDATVDETVIMQPNFAFNALGEIRDLGLQTRVIRTDVQSTWADPKALTVPKFMGLK